jgi:hypothetical protein
MLRLPHQPAPFVYGIIQPATTTAVAAAVTIHQLTDFGALIPRHWFLAWCIALFTTSAIVVLGRHSFSALFLLCQRRALRPIEL